MPEQKSLNGVDVSKVETTLEALQADPGMGKFKFRARNRWQTGGYNKSRINDYYGAYEQHERQQPFELAADEPPMLAGEDRGANPVEHLLNALASCMTTTMVYHAALRGIRIEELESELEGDIDVRAFLGLTNEVRRGYDNIRVRFKVKTDADNLKRLEAFSKLSPVFDVTANGTRIDVSVESK